jgi:hypothetical protein
MSNTTRPEIRVVPPFLLSETLIDEIRLFRGMIWGDVPAVVNGRNHHHLDLASWHILLYLNGQIIGTARYYRDSVVDLGGFALKRRGSRDVVRIINAAISLAGELDDRNFRSFCSVTSGSAAILKKLGGVIVGDSQPNLLYEDTAVMIEFGGVIPEMLAMK